MQEEKPILGILGPRHQTHYGQLSVGNHAEEDLMAVAQKGINGDIKLVPQGPFRHTLTRLSL